MNWATYYSFIRLILRIKPPLSIVCYQTSRNGSAESDLSLKIESSLKQIRFLTTPTRLIIWKGSRHEETLNILYAALRREIKRFCVKIPGFHSKSHKLIGTNLLSMPCYGLPNKPRQIFSKQNQAQLKSLIFKSRDCCH